MPVLWRDPNPRVEHLAGAFGETEAAKPPRRHLLPLRPPHFARALLSGRNQTFGTRLNGWSAQISAVPGPGSERVISDPLPPFRLGPVCDVSASRGNSALGGIPPIFVCSIRATGKRGPEHFEQLPRWVIICEV